MAEKSRADREEWSRTIGGEKLDDYKEDSNVLQRRVEQNRAE